MLVEVYIEAFTLFAKRALQIKTAPPAIKNAVCYFFALYKKYLVDQDNTAWPIEFIELLEEMVERFEYPINRGTDGRKLYSTKNPVPMLLDYIDLIKRFNENERKMGESYDLTFCQITTAMLHSRQHVK